MRSALILAPLVAALVTAVPSPGRAQPKPPPLGAPEAGFGLPPSDLGRKPPPADAAPRGRAVAPQAGPGGKPPPLRPGEEAPPQEVSSGTGFLVGGRQALTNFHVVRSCTGVRARNAQGREIPVSVRATDERQDLALLELGAEAGPPLAFRAGPVVRRGESVVTYGFPLAGVLSSGPTLTTGDISALAGLADNPAQFQISAPVQPGNSGGPLLDSSGNVVGVIVSKLNAQRIAQRTGDIPQNVNFAVKGSEAVEFLRRNGVQPRLGDSARPRSPAEIGEVADPSVLFLRCLR